MTLEVIYFHTLHVSAFPRAMACLAEKMMFADPGFVVMVLLSRLQLNIEESESTADLEP